MTILRMLLVASIVSASLATSLITLAQSEDDHARDQIQRCIDAQPDNLNPRPCKIVDGKVVVETDSPSGRAFAKFAIFAILWSAIPLVAGGMIASSRGQSVGLALLLTFFLGWIGLAIVWFVFKNVPKPEAPSAAV